MDLLKVAAAHLLMQIRHNLVVPEKPFFRRGRCVANTAHYLEGSENPGFWDEAGGAWFGCGGHGGQLCRGCGAMATRPRRLRDPGGAGRPGRVGRSEASILPCGTTRRWSLKISRRRWRQAMPILPPALPNSRATRRRHQRRTVEARERGRHGRRIQPRILLSVSPWVWLPAMPTMSRACRVRWPAISSCSAISGTSCARAGFNADAG